MPKKAGKKEEPQDGDGEADPTSLNSVWFNIEMEAYHVGGHHLKLTHNWLDPTSLEQVDEVSEFFKDWELIKKEGDEEEGEKEEEDTGKKDKKGKAPAEELDDCPRIIKWSRNKGEEDT